MFFADVWSITDNMGNKWVQTWAMSGSFVLKWANNARSHMRNTTWLCSYRCLACSISENLWFFPSNMNMNMNMHMIRTQAYFIEPMIVSLANVGSGGGASWLWSTWNRLLNHFLDPASFAGLIVLAAQVFAVPVTEFIVNLTYTSLFKCQQSASGCWRMIEGSWKEYNSELDEIHTVVCNKKVNKNLPKENFLSAFVTHYRHGHKIKAKVEETPME